MRQVRELALRPGVGGESKGQDSGCQRERVERLDKGSYRENQKARAIKRETRESEHVEEHASERARELARDKMPKKNSPD